MPVIERVEVEVVVVVLVFEFCAKTRLPKLRTKTRAITIPKLFLTDVSPFDVPLGRLLIMINGLLNFERDEKKALMLLRPEVNNAMSIARAPKRVQRLCQFENKTCLRFCAEFRLSVYFGAGFVVAIVRDVSKAATKAVSQVPFDDEDCEISFCLYVGS